MSTKRWTVDALSRALCPAIDEFILSRTTTLPVLLSSRSDPTHRRGHGRHAPSSCVTGVRGVHTGSNKPTQQPRRKKLKIPEWATAPLPTLRPKRVVARKDSEPQPELPQLDHFPTWALNDVTLPALGAEAAASVPEMEDAEVLEEEPSDSPEELRSATPGECTTAPDSEPGPQGVENAQDPQPATPLEGDGPVEPPESSQPREDSQPNGDAPSLKTLGPTKPAPEKADSATPKKPAQSQVPEKPEAEPEPRAFPSWAMDIPLPSLPNTTDPVPEQPPAKMELPSWAQAEMPPKVNFADSQGPQMPQKTAQQVPVRYVFSRQPEIAKEPPVPTDKPAAPKWTPPKPGSVNAATLIRSLEDLPRETPFALTPVIYEALRSLRKQKDQGNKIRRLVQFLVEQRGERPNAPLYEALVTANWDTATGSADELVAIYKDMEAAGVEPSPGWYHSALRLLAIHPDYLSRNRYLEKMKESNIALTDDGKFSVALGLLRDGQTEMALDRWDEMRRSKMQIPEWVSSIFFYALMMRGVVDEALQLFHEILEMAGDKPEGVPLILWSYLLDECSRNLHYEGTKFVWDTMVTPGMINPADGILLNVLNTAARHGDAALATTVVELLAAREARVGLHHYEPLMESYVQGGELESAFRVLCIMNDAGLVPDHSGTRPILAALRQTPELVDQAIDILSDLQRVPAAAINVVLEAHIVNTIAAAAAAIASTSQTTPETLSYLDEPNPNTNPKPDMTSLLTLYRRLADLSISGPNEQTFLLLLDQCTHTQPAAALLSEMDRFAIRPTPAILRHLIRCFAHDGNLDVALGYAAELGRLSPSALARAHAARARARMLRDPISSLPSLPLSRNGVEEEEEEAEETEKPEEDHAPLSLREVCRYVLDERTLWVLARRCGKARDPRVWELAAAALRRSVLFSMAEAVKLVDGVPRLDGRESVGLEVLEVQKELRMMGLDF